MYLANKNREEFGHLIRYSTLTFMVGIIGLTMSAKIILQQDFTPLAGSGSKGSCIPKGIYFFRFQYKNQTLHGKFLFLR
jgi:hypothetical protein